MGLFSSALQAITRFFGFGAGAQAAQSFNQDARAGGYAVREAMYDGSLYRPQVQGGLLETVMLEELGRKVDLTKMRPQCFYNPIPAIVDAYSSIYPGVFGREIRVADKVNEEDVNEKLPTAIARVWKMSNLDTEKGKLLEWGPNLGTVGVRIVATNDADLQKRRVAIRFDHPRRIADFDEDDRGNVTQVLLRYKVDVRGALGSKQISEVEVEELLTKDRFSLTYNGVEQLTPEQQINTLGVCPYVILRHRDRGERFGDWAYRGIEPVIHAINWMIARQDKSIDRHIFPKWFAAAAGQPPTNINLGEESVAYTKIDPNAPPPIFIPLVAGLNQADTRTFWLEVIDLIKDRCPEVLLNDMKLLSGLSGESLAQVLKPVEARVLGARAAYDHSIIRAVQIALSWGIVLGLWDLGTGTGTPEAAESAFRQGLEDFEFADRPALPQSVYDKLKQVEFDTARRSKDIADATAAQGVVSNREQLRIMGYSDERIEEILKERATEDTMSVDNPTLQGGTANQQGGPVGQGGPDSFIQPGDGLNGAQVTAVVTVLQNIAQGTLTVDQAVPLIMQLGIAEDVARRIIGRATKRPAPQPAPEPQPQ